MARSILHMRQKALGFPRQLKQSPHDRQIVDDVQASDIVNRSHTAAFEDRQDSSAVIFHMQPVALLFAVAINREGFVIKSIGNHQRKKLFGKLIRAVIVR